MEAVLFPAYALLGRLRNEFKFSLMAVLFGWPLYLVAFAEPSPLQVRLTVVSLCVLAYMAAGFYAQAMKGWADVLPQFQRLSDGDLGACVGSGIDRAGQFAEAMGIAGEINAHFGRIVRQASAGSEGIGMAAQEIAAGSENLSQRTARQAATLNGVAASMEQLSATVRHNAASCATARAVGEQANGIAQGGQEIVRQMARTMAGIDESARQVVRIVAVIDGIAFQTNILALNAAVEAARAADQGRGFAVVAGEVRSLAQKSAEAAKEIKAMIEASVGNVEAGTRLVDETGRIIGQAVQGVDEVTGRIREIATASQEQSVSVDEVGKALAQLSRLTEQNAAAVREATAAAASLSQEAGQLSLAIGKFRL
jgi:methyl-accepting chemotaxis protein